MICFLTGLTLAASLLAAVPVAAQGDVPAGSGWQSPPAELLEVLHAPQLPWVWTAPGPALYAASASSREPNRRRFWVR